MTSSGNFSPPARTDALIAALLGLAALALFLWRITDPARIMFDEFHYVPATRTLLDLAGLPNAEHPPLGKWLIGFGMTLFGDNPFGWRIMSALFGALLVSAGVMAARWLTGTRAAAVMTGLLLLLCQMLFVQARIAMLDIFMASFSMLAFQVLAAAARTGFADRWRLALAGALMGLATAAKWNAIPFVAVAILLFVVLRLRGNPRRAPGPIEGVLWLGPFAILVYLATFLPYLFLHRSALSPGGIILQQIEMLKLQSQVLAPHPYQSIWWQWVLSLRPIWYFYEPVDGIQRGVLLIGNPAISWGGLLALPACLCTGFRRGDRALLVIPLLWAASLAFFILIPKSVMFYYHYFPAEMLLCFAIAAMLDRGFWQRGNRLVPAACIGFAALLFIDFYPILSAAALDGPQAFNRWMWLESWR